MAFFKGKVKSPSDTAKHIKQHLAVYDKAGSKPKDLEKATEEMSKDLVMAKFLLYGDPENKHEPNPEQINGLYKAIFDEDILPGLIRHMAKLEFEAKKDVVTIFNNVLRRQVGNHFTTVDYLAKNKPILIDLVNGYGHADIAMNSGSMLRECIRHESLARVVLQSEDFFKFFQFVETSNFDVAADAFSTFRELLTKHKALCAEFLEQNYDTVFSKYTLLLNSQNYVTKRQALKLLSELLLDRANFNIMTKYIASSDNLKLMMNMLKDKSRNIQYEAFHVFKVFVANPNKPKPILEILARNKEKLANFLQSFHNDKADEQFNEEKSFLIKQIGQLQLPA